MSKIISSIVALIMFVNSTIAILTGEAKISTGGMSRAVTFDASPGPFVLEVIIGFLCAIWLIKHVITDDS